MYEDQFLHEENLSDIQKTIIEKFKSNYQLGVSSDLKKMRKSTFAICPRGKIHSWTPTFYHAISVGAIPVVISDSWVLPFHQIIHEEDLIVRVRESQVKQLDLILEETMIDEVTLKTKRRGVARHWRDFLQWDYIAYNFLLTLKLRMRNLMDKFSLSE